MTDYKEAQQQIENILSTSRGTLYLTSLILNLKWPDDSPMIGVIAKDQSLPEILLRYTGNINKENYAKGVAEEIQRDMLKANFRLLAEKE